MGQTVTPEKGPVQAAGLQPTGDGSGAEDNGGQDNFSMSIIPEGSASAKQSQAKKPGAGQPAKAGEKTVFEGGEPGTEGAVQDQGQQQPGSKSDQNAENKSQRQSQAGWQQLTEAVTALTEKVGKMEQQSQQQPQGGKEGKQEEGKSQGAPDNEAIAKLTETLASTNARLERMDFENSPENADLRSKDLADSWKKVNTDPKFKDFSLADRADFVRGKTGKSQADTMRDQLSRSEGSMPRGSGGGAPPSGGNQNVTEEDVAVGAAFGFTRADLEDELS